MKRWSAGAVLGIAALAAGVGGAFAKDKAAAYAPRIDPADFRATVDHPYFPLVPGTRYLYRETEGSRVSENEVTVLAETRVVLGVTCTVVHDVVRTGGRVKEDTRDWYAQDRQGNVWYFGEDTREFHPRGRVSTQGSWEAGVSGGQPGILMKALPAPGEPYRQEYRRGVAEDMGQVVATGETVAVPAGTYSDCVKTRDWSLLEAGHEFKWYARGVGLVRTESASKEVAVLVSVTRP